MSHPVTTSPDTAPSCVPQPANPAEWFNKEIHAHDSQLKAYLRGSFPSIRDVDDLVQESYLRVWRQIGTAPIRSAKSFLFAIARRLAIDGLRHVKVRAVDPVRDLASVALYDNGNSAADSAVRTELVELLCEAVESLPLRCREVVVLRKFQFLSVRDTAHQLGIKEQTVEMQLMRGNIRIRAYLAARGITAPLGREP